MNAIFSKTKTRLSSYGSCLGLFCLMAACQPSENNSHLEAQAVSRATQTPLVARTKGNLSYADRELSEDFIQNHKNFVWKSLSLMLEDNPHTNYVTAPLGLQQVLSGLAALAGPKLKSEYKQALHWDSPQEGPPDILILQHKLQAAALDVQYEVGQALAFRQDEYQLETQTQKTLEEYLDFFLIKAQNVESYDKEIKRWLDSQGLSSVEEVKHTTFSLFAQMSFEGQWAKPFDPAQTKLDTFHEVFGTKKAVMMMQQEERLLHFRDKQSQAVLLPYENRNFALMLVLPMSPKADLLSFSQTLAKQPHLFDWTAENTAWSPRSVALSLPRLKVTYTSHFDNDLDNNHVLRRLGFRKTFEPDADFSGMGRQGGVDFLSQTVAFSMDEQGSKVKSLSQTGDKLRSGNGPDSETLSFRADRPFLYFLVHIPTQTILLAGTCNTAPQT